MMRLAVGLLCGLMLMLVSCTKNLAEQEPTCNDGIQNQNEASVDCGGVCPNTCPTCTDGIRNQGEAGVDCGGPCPACASIECTTCISSVQGGNSITYCEDSFNSQEAYEAAVNNAIANGWFCN